MNCDRGREEQLSVPRQSMEFAGEWCDLHSRHWCHWARASRYLQPREVRSVDQFWMELRLGESF